MAAFRATKSNTCKGTPNDTYFTFCKHCLYSWSVNLSNLDKLLITYPKLGKNIFACFFFWLYDWTIQVIIFSCSNGKFNVLDVQKPKFSALRHHQVDFCLGFKKRQCHCYQQQASSGKLSPGQSGDTIKCCPRFYFI